MIDYFEALRGLVIDDDNGTLGIIEELEKQYKALQIENDLLKRENKALDEESVLKCKLNQKLEKALDKACDYLERVNIQDCKIFDEYDDIPDIAYSFDKKLWKEWAKKVE